MATNDQSIKSSQKEQPIACVYFLRARNGFTKIGQTVDLARRLKEHWKYRKGEYRFQVLFVIVTPYHRELEEGFLWLFRSELKRETRTGDWFMLTEDDLVFIRSLCVELE